MRENGRMKARGGSKGQVITFSLLAYTSDKATRVRDSVPSTDATFAN